MNTVNPVPPGDEILAAIATKLPVSGYTHNFYRYPARFSPLFVREVIRRYSQAGNVVLDPFMGGGTTVVEALALGRRAIGIDLNPLAHFVTTAKTTPLSENDCALLQEWADKVRTSLRRGVGTVTERVCNLPWHVQQLEADLMAHAAQLPLRRQRHFARCALLKTAQWGIDCKKELPSSREMVEKFAGNLADMIRGIREFTTSCQSQGLRKRFIRRSRLLLCRSAIGPEEDVRLKLCPKPNLVVTSPPYPSVHISLCLPRDLRKHLVGYACQTVPQAGLAGKTNGELLALAERSGWQVLLTMDQGMPYQQNLAGRTICLAIIRAKSNRLPDLLPHVPAILAALPSLKAGEVIQIG